MSYFRLTLRGNFKVNMGVVQLAVERIINYLLYRVGTKVNGLINLSVQLNKPRGFLKVNSM